MTIGNFIIKHHGEHMNQKTFSAIFYSDPGHGWAKVKRSVLQNLGIEEKISEYSYQNGDNVFLEEDCDLYVLHERLKQDNVTMRLVPKSSDKESRIRSYSRFKPQEAV